MDVDEAWSDDESAHIDTAVGNHATELANVNDPTFPNTNVSPSRFLSGPVIHQALRDH